MIFSESLGSHGYARIYELFADGFFSDHMFFYRVVKGFLVQFGVSNDKTQNEKWGWKNTIKDDPHLPGQKFEPGTISFAGK